MTGSCKYRQPTDNGRGDGLGEPEPHRREFQAREALNALVTDALARAQLRPLAAGSVTLNEDQL